MKTGECVMVLSQSADRLHASVRHAPWQNLSRNAFVAQLEKTIPILHQLVGELEATHRHWIDHGLLETDEIGAALIEFQKLETLLTKNLELENAKRNVDLAANRFDADGRPELYSAVEQKILATLLKLRFLLERLSITAHKHTMAPIEAKPVARQALTLLREKESELQSLKTKYELLRQNAYLTHNAADTPAELESQLRALERELIQTETKLRGEHETLTRELAPMLGRIHAVSTLLDSHTKTSRELSAMHDRLFATLAKERDYAKNILLDIEHDSLKLRNQYSNELLHLHEHKLSHQKRLEDKFERDNADRQRTIDKQEEIIHHLKQQLDAIEHKMRQVEEKNKELQTAIQLHQKHAAVRNALKPKKDRAQPTKKNK